MKRVEERSNVLVDFKLRSEDSLDFCLQWLAKARNFMRSVSDTHENNEAKDSLKKVLYLRETGCQ